MSRESYQRKVERRLLEGDVAVVSMPGKTGYIYHRGPRYWWIVVRNGDYEAAEERPCPAHRRDRLFDEHAVKAVMPEEVAGPIAALSRAAPVDDEDVETGEGQQTLDGG